MIDGACAAGRKTQLQAEQFCLAGAARLCTYEELLDGAAKGTGCNLDNVMSWTSSKCDGGSWIVRGKGGKAVCEGIYSNAASLHGVRCCAGMKAGSLSRVSIDGDNFQEPYDDDSPRIFGEDVTTPPSEATPERNPPLYKQCNAMVDHGHWNFVDDYKICGGSKINGECVKSGAATLLEAEAFCMSGGARLCTAEELFDKRTKGTGCFFDNQLVWSGTACREGTWVVEGKGRTQSCEANTEKRFGARCCADGLKSAPFVSQEETGSTGRSRRAIESASDAMSSPPAVNGADADWALSIGLVLVGLASLTVIGVVTIQKAGALSKSRGRDKQTHLADVEEPKAQLFKATPAKKTGMKRATSFVGAI